LTSRDGPRGQTYPDYLVRAASGPHRRLTLDVGVVAMKTLKVAAAGRTRKYRTGWRPLQAMLKWVRRRAGDGS
jgi:hypothetical protein